MINPVTRASSPCVPEASSLEKREKATGLEAQGTHRQDADGTKLHKAATAMEATFIKMLLEQMQKGSSMFGKSAGSGIYQDFFNQAVAESMASKSQFGIAALLEKQMASRLNDTQMNPENETNVNA